jgi:hypothetical protein
MLSGEQLQELKRKLDESEALHHKVMAKMSDPKFDLLASWEQKERLDTAIGSYIRTALSR